MRGLQKSKRVSWASDVNLCQVKLFLSEESPSLIGLSGQDHLQAKESWSPYTTGAGHDDNLPPGFEESHPANVLHNKLSQIPIIQWQCPAKFAFDPIWQVVDGDESNEVKSQYEREMRVLEAVYPRQSAIPPNPSLLIGVDGSYEPDQNPPLIPITPIEDDDAAAAADTSYDDVPPNTDLVSSQPQQPSTQIALPQPQQPAPQITHPQPQQAAPLTPHPQPQQPAAQTPRSQSNPTISINPSPNFIPSSVRALGVEPHAVTAAYNALSTMMANSGQVDIDPDLLLTILKDPKLIEELGSIYGASPATQNLPNPRLQGNTLPDSPIVHLSRTEPTATSLAAAPIRPFYPPPGRPGPIPNLRPHTPEVMTRPPPPPSHIGVPVAKDINYYKSLIQQHGGERQEPVPQQIRPSQGSRIMKPCIYFNSSRGCRYGAKCAYQHDASSQQKVNGIPEMPSAKRMKMDRELTGT